jgi:zinc/manganese transport system substrate-binding protein
MTPSRIHILAATILCALSAPAFADPVKVVAAENFYGDLATQVGGPNVAVTSILSSPDQDPHLFEASPETAKSLSDAKVLIVKGLHPPTCMD